MESKRVISSHNHLTNHAEVVKQYTSLGWEVVRSESNDSDTYHLTELTKPFQLTESEAIANLQIEQRNSDTEDGHINADDILCCFLLTLGYDRLVEEYRKIDKWYA